MKRHSSSARRKGSWSQARLLIVLIVSLFRIATAAEAILVNGTITDANGTAMPLMQVEVRNDNFPFPSNEIDTVFTNGVGGYSTSKPVAGHDVFLRVKWKFLGRTSATHTLIVDQVNLNNNGSVTTTNTFGPDDSPTTANIALPGPIVINLALSDGLTGVTTLLQRIRQAFNYYIQNKGAIDWKLDYDVSVRILNVNRRVGFFNSDAFAIFLAPTMFDGTGGTIAPYDIFHEMGHLVHFKFRGEALPVGPNCGCHTHNSENNVGCAITEGWADYVAEQTGNFTGLPNSLFYDSARDTNRSHWRGAKVTSFNPCNFGPPDTGFDNGGDIVQGAVSGFLFDHHTYRGVFANNFRVMHDDDPDHFFEFCEELIEDSGGANTLGTSNIYRIMQEHGIVYNRLTLEDTVFDEVAPDDAEPDEGNFSEIDGKAFVRGKVHVNYDPLSAGDLHVASTVTISDARVGWKAAAAGSNENLQRLTVNGTFNFSPFKAREFFSFDEIQIDTTTMGGDGGYDLIVQGKNVDGFIDSFDPDWAADPTHASDEKYLKKIGAWFDLDRDATTPAANADEEGQIFVDNTAPQILTFSPQ